MISRATSIAASCLVAHAAAADPTSYRVQWTRAPGAEACIDTPALLVGVEARLGRPIGTAPVEARVIDGHVERAGDGYHARIVVRDEQGATLGERELDEPSGHCGALDAKLTLVIALAIDSDAVARRAADPIAPTPTITAPAQSVTVVQPTPHGTPWRLELGVFGVAALGVMPGAGGGGGVAVAIDAPSVPVIVASGNWWAPDHTSVAAGGSRFTRMGGGLEICPQLFARDRVELAACVGVDVARMTATGFDFDRNARVTDWVVHGVGLAALSWRFGTRWRLVAAAGSWVPITRPRFVYESGAAMRVVYEAPPAAAVLRVGWAVRF